MSGPDVAILAPMAEELAALVPRLAERVRERRGELATDVGRLGSRRVVVAAIGDGAARSAAALQRVLASWAPGRVLLVGVAGGLTADLGVGDVVVGTAVVSSEDSGGRSHVEPLTAFDCGARSGTVVSSPRIASTAREKTDLLAGVADGGPAVVDLEAWAAAGVVARSGVPLSVLRAVSDGYDEDLPLDFERFRASDGSVDRSAVVRHVALRPTLVPRMLELKARVESCSRALADAVEAGLRG